MTDNIVLFVADLESFTFAQFNSFDFLITTQRNIWWYWTLISLLSLKSFMLFTLSFSQLLDRNCLFNQTILGPIIENLLPNRLNYINNLFFPFKFRLNSELFSNKWLKFNFNWMQNILNSFCDNHEEIFQK